MSEPTRPDDPIERLPAAYATYLRLEAAGTPPAVVAAELGVPQESLPVLAALAREKLERLRAGVAVPPTDES